MRNCLLQRKKTFFKNGVIRYPLKNLKFLFLIFFSVSSSVLYAQQIIKGRVSVGDTALVGATIQIKGANISTQTDANGSFTISAPSNATLVITSVGYSPEEVKVGNRSTINVQLRSSASELGEVVVVGYGTQKKTTITGSVASINSEKMSIAPLTSTTNTLVGLLPGLAALQNSGTPGNDAAELRIRGFGAALVIVDGVEANFNSLDPSQIESVSILKDGAASIYGARAGNGVILVTTKRGKNQKPAITLNSSYTLQGVTRILKPGSSGQVAEMAREEYIQSGKDPAGAPWTQQAIDTFYQGGNPAYLNTDWYSHTFRNWAPQQNHNLSIRGGSKKIKYFGYFGYANQETMVKLNGGDYSRYNVQSNVDADITDNLKMSIDVSTTIQNKNFPIRGLNNGASFWQDYYTTKPWYPATLPDPTKVPWGGIDVGGVNSVSNIDLMGYNRTDDQNFRGTAMLTYDFKKIKGLQAKAKMNYTVSDVYQKTFNKPIKFWTYNTTTMVYTQSASFNESRLSENLYRFNNLTQQYSLDYNKTLSEKHKISLLALYESIDYKSNFFSATRTNLLTPLIDQLFIGSNIGMGNNGSANEMGRTSFVGRFNYSFDDRYLLETNFRADASAKFSSNKRWGYFPSVSAGWVISREKFMERIGVIDNLKLRASYGLSGNDAVGNFQYLSGYSTQGSVLFDDRQIPGLYITSLANPNLTWEKMTIYNAGLDYSFFKEKIYGTLDIFYRKRNGIPATRSNSLPSTFGSTLPPENINSLNDRGFEFSLGTRGSVRNFSYDINTNISWSRSKWDHFEEPDYVDPDQIRINKRSGQWTDRAMAYVSDGLFTSQKEIDNYNIKYVALGGNSTLKPGDIKYKDLNGDGVLDWKDHKEIGKGSFPHWTYGVNTTLHYKNFSLTTLFQGAFGFSTYVNITAYGTNSVMYDLRWTEKNNNPNALVSRLGGSSSNDFYSDYRWKTNSYVRLKVASFGYDFSKAGLNKLGIDKIRFYVAGTNLLTISTLDKFRIDPEVESGSALVYPQQRTITLGLNLSF